MTHVGILGNCCTHGAGLAASLRHRPDVRIVAGYDPDPRRGPELAEAMQAPLAESFEEVAHNPRIEVLVIATDPCDKALMVELAAAAGKHVLLNKPFADSLDNARRIVSAVERSGIVLVHDIPMVRGLPVYAKLKQEVVAGLYGRPISYAHSFGMTFAHDFPIADLWPERFDPPQVAGGGEMTNMGCYAIDYAVALLGRPRAVQARRRAFWHPYQQAGVENWGQIILDYGDLFAMLAVGKQTLDEPRQHSNWLSIQFPHRNFLIEPHSNVLLVDGVPRPVQEYLAGFQVEGSFDELLRCIRTGARPDSDAQVGMLGVEVLMAAYRSTLEDGRAVPLPLEDGSNPLVA